jgi:Ca-activated chloride channel family protein
MKSTVVLDYHLATGRVGYVVRALLKFEGEQSTAEGKTPLDISLVLDRSGSMGGEKIRYAREAAAFLVRRLRPTDVVSVVAFDDQVRTVAEPATGDGQAGLPSAIEAIDVGGSTNLSGGWLRGRELVSRGAKSDKAKVKRVLLLTDGQANVGVTDPQSLRGLCGRALEDGVTTSTIGFGADYDEELLRSMADAGGGHSYYIENPDQAPGVFEEEIEGLLSLAAQNIEVSVKPDSQVELVNIYNDYASHGGPDGITVSVGDLYARDPKSLLIEFFAPGLEAMGDRTIAELKVTADVLKADGTIEHQQILIPVAATLSGEGREEPEIRSTQVLLDAARARDEARRLGRNGDFTGAANMLREASVACLASLGMGEQAEDLAAMASKYEARSVSEADEKYLYQRAYNARRGKASYEDKISRVRRLPK